VTDLSQALGYAVLGAVASDLILFAVLFVRLPAPHSFISGLAQVVFLPRKRRRYLAVLSLEASFLLLAGIAWSLVAIGVLGGGLVSVAVSLLVLAAVLSQDALTWVGLRAEPVEEAEWAAIARDAPATLQSLWAAPVQYRQEIEAQRKG
jgi:hypothetical protein